MKNEYPIKLNLFIIFYILISFANAHVNLLLPVGNETFQVGSEMHIEWQIGIDHGNCTWELYFSADSGKTWQPISVGIPKTTLNYNWLIPESAVTNGGVIQVVQNNTTYQDFSDDAGYLTITMVTGLNKPDNISPGKFILNDAHPNPFNATVVIPFELGEQATVEINIYDVTGRKVERLAQEQFPAGEYRIRWTPINLPSGIYFYTIQNGTHSQSKRLVYIK